MARTISEAVLAARSEIIGVGMRIKLERDVAAAGPINAGRLARLAMIVSQSRVHLDSLAIGTKHRAFARTDMDDPSFNVEAGLAAVQVTLTAIIDWIVTNYPVSANGFQETFIFTTDPALDTYGVSTEVAFDNIFTAGFVTAADDFSVAAQAFIG